LRKIVAAREGVLGEQRDGKGGIVGLWLEEGGGVTVGNQIGEIQVVREGS